jgi:hypothetical protein
MELCHTPARKIVELIRAINHARRLRWPILFLPALSVAMILFCDRIGLSVIWSLILVSLGAVKQ